MNFYMSDISSIKLLARHIRLPEAHDRSKTKRNSYPPKPTATNTPLKAA